MFCIHPWIRGHGRTSWPLLGLSPGFTVTVFWGSTWATPNKGRIDCVLTTNEVIYVIEFKLHGTKEQALQQIIDNQYPQKYSLQDRKLCLIGVEFDQPSRNIGGYVMGLGDKRDLE